MITHTVSEARTKLYRLIDEAAATHKPILIVGKCSNAVLVSEEDWSAIQETLFLLSISEIRESIKKSLAAPAAECKKEPGW